MIGNQELRIRERAHVIWEREGRPEGRATAHWQMAAAEIAAEASAKPAGKAPRAKAARAAANGEATAKAEVAPKADKTGGKSQSAAAARPKRSRRAAD